MNSEENNRQEYFRRIRRLKRILRPLPRRATIHRYPVLKWFAATARKRSYLWSFRKEHIIPAIYIGSIFALLPPPTPQMPLTFLLVLIIRCNLMVGAALTFITNPFTIAPLYYADYKIGGFILNTFWHPSLMEEVSPEVVEMISGETGEAVQITVGWMQKFLAGWTQTAIGGLVLGAAFGVVIHLIYLFVAHRYKKRSKSSQFTLLGKIKQHIKHDKEPAAGVTGDDSATIAAGSTADTAERLDADAAKNKPSHFFTPNTPPALDAPPADTDKSP